MGSLKSFIKAVRSSKTIADERTVIRKESAQIRTSFRDSSINQTNRRTNIAKLLFLYILGEKTHFGQVECIKLISSPNFSDKRLGYLATMLLLDENQEVLTLLTNSLDNDMNHPNTFVVGLALCCLGNIASLELSRDLYQNVLTVMGNGNPYLRKKSLFVSAKLIDKNPELTEFFIPKIPALINETNNACLLGVLKLIQSIYKNDYDSREQLTTYIPNIISQLKRITSLGFNPEYDVLGVSDPFLQVSLIETLRILCGDPSSSKYLDQVNDILTIISSNIENGKNSAHCILYECVKTIFSIDSDQSLKVLGVNILGKFLSTKDNNTRYVSLNSLLSVITIEPLAVQRHRSTIVSCLSDGDVSIKKRALELSFGILNEQNIRILTREILIFLENCENELKSYITSKLTIACELYSPNLKWKFDTLIKMLKLCGNNIDKDIIQQILTLIIQCDTSLQQSVVLKLFTTFVKNDDQYALLIISIWCIGEYPTYLLGQEIEIGEEKSIIDENMLLNYISKSINNSTYTEIENIKIVSMSLTSLLKFSISATPAMFEKIRKLIDSFKNDINIEIQIRASEYSEILKQSIDLKKGILEKMPAPPLKKYEKLSLNSYKERRDNVSRETKSRENKAIENKSNLLDLSDNKQIDLLTDIFGIDEPKQEQESKEEKPIQSINAFKNSHLDINLTLKKIENHEANIEIIINNITHTDDVSKFQLLIAVPKTQTLKISTINSNFIKSGDNIKQFLKILGKEGGKLKLRIKLNYVIGGNEVNEMFDSVFEKTL